MSVYPPWSRRSQRVSGTVAHAEEVLRRNTLLERVVSGESIRQGDLLLEPMYHLTARPPYAVPGIVSYRVHMSGEGVLDIGRSIEEAAIGSLVLLGRRGVIEEVFPYLLIRKGEARQGFSHTHVDAPAGFFQNGMYRLSDPFGEPATHLPLLEYMCAILGGRS